MARATRHASVSLGHIRTSRAAHAWARRHGPGSVPYRRAGSSVSTAARADNLDAPATRTAKRFASARPDPRIVTGVHARGPDRRFASTRLHRVLRVSPRSQPRVLRDSGTDESEFELHRNHAFASLTRHDPGPCTPSPHSMACQSWRAGVSDEATGACFSQGVRFDGHFPRRGEIDLHEG